MRDHRDKQETSNRLGGRRMSGKTVTRADLSEAVYQQVGLSRTESSALVETVLAEICGCLASGETVKLSSFGSFVVRSKGRRVGRNPKTGVEVAIEPRQVMVFKPSNVLKARINGMNGAGDHDDDE
ncbi:integration host factor subunit alpha [Methylobacterium sp. BTF04]|uniref:integration host factor subunit alpha n=1 Tax=Methylobacterium sp. BTF04 TaxID=2708300 RepID=UPI0032B17BC5